MTDELLPRVRSALAGRYAVDREIGRGGMAAVFLAQDLENQRPVALKVFLPEVASILGRARFAREIVVAAGLSHPNILPLYGSGEVDEIIYYAMPYVDGETLRQRLQRERQLSIDESIELVGQVAAALSYAHAKGVVHRDIKPENILLGDGRALVADFGIAASLAEAGPERLTESGVALGTAAYMSPEQAAGAGPIDGRSDVYALGCVLYEMLAGEPPFTGPTVQAILARQTVEAPRSIRTVRPTVTRELERAIAKALAKVPADRFRTAKEFADALDSARLESGVSSSRTRRLALSYVVAGVLAAAIVSTALLRSVRRPTEGLDPSLIVVVPFRVSGTVDPSLVSPTSLSELLLMKLAGEGGLHPADPGTTLREWKALGQPGPAESPTIAIRLAKRVRAGEVVVGTVVGTGTQLVIDCRLLAVSSGREIARADISGPSDQLLTLLDRVAAQLLIKRSGEADRRLASLTSENLPALRSYLAGLDKYRQGRYAEAVKDYERALVADSSFALASLRLAVSLAMLGNAEASDQAVATAWQHRERLGSRDSILLVAFAGPRYPGPSPLAEQLHQWERTVDTLPESAESAYELGDKLFHWGPAVGAENPWRHAAEAFRNALRSDSTLAAPLEHLIDLAAIFRDTAEARRLGARYLESDSASDHADYVRWRVGTATGDARLLGDVRRRFSTLSSDLLERIGGTAQLDGVSIEDAGAATEELRKRVKEQYELFFSVVRSRELAFNLGQAAKLSAWPSGRVFSVPIVDNFLVIESLYLGADSTLAARSAAERRRYAEGPAPVGGVATAPIYMDYCTVGLWEARRLPNAQLEQFIRKLATAVHPEREAQSNYIPLCRLLLIALETHAHKRPSAPNALAALDSLLRSGPITNSYLLFAASREAARLQEASGQPEQAFATVRRRRYVHESLGVLGLAILLREEGRLAVLLGKRTEAINAYRHYLALRGKAEPPFGEERDRIAKTLDSLLALPR